MPEPTSSSFDWETGAWNILKLMMKERNFLIQHQIGPFNEFIDKGLKNVIEQFNPIVLNYDFVGKQQFYKLKNQDTSVWTEYVDPADIYKVFKEHFSTVAKQVTTFDLSEHLSNHYDKEKMIQEEFERFLSTEVETKSIDVNKHRYDLEADIYFHSLTPPTIFENNGSQKLMYPNEARLRNFTYASVIYVTFEYRVRERKGEGLNEIIESEKKVLQKINCGKLPIMLGSKACILENSNSHQKIDYEECEYDEGGYFIVNGTEKVIVGQERQAENKIYVFKNSKSQSKYSHIAEVKSLPDKKILTPKNIQVKITSKENIHGRNIKVTVPHIKSDIPLFVVFKALGVINDYDIALYILHSVEQDKWGEYTQFLRASLEEASTITNQQLAKEYMCKHVNMMGYDRDKSEKDRRITYLNDIIKNDFLPHVGEDYKAKCFYLGHMVKRLLDVFLKKKEADDRDSYVNKRIDSAGALMAGLFRQYYTKLVKDMKTNINKEYANGSWRASKNFQNIINGSNIYKIIKYSTITTGLKFALATGNWGLKNNTNKQGIAQVLSRLTYNSTLSHLRRVNTPMEKTSKLVAPRKLHGTQMMYICGAETPEGGSVGVVKNLALSCHLTSYSDVQPVIDILQTLEIKSMETMTPDQLFDTTKVFVNGSWLFITTNPKDVVDQLLNLRRQGIIHIHTSILWKINDFAIEIYTDAGRCTRPLYIVKQNEFVITNDQLGHINNGLLNWNNLLVGSINHKDTQEQQPLKEGVIEFIDVQEEDQCMIAVNQAKLLENGTKAIMYQYTHAEIHPSFLQGVLASIIPFSDHNQSPRNTYQCLGIHETVLMADGSRKEIKDVCEGDQVVTWDLKTNIPSVTRVIHQYVRPTENKIYKVKTVSGREIIATGNHNFMTPDGWKSVESMITMETAIGIHLSPVSMSQSVSEQQIILDASMLYDKLNVTGMTDSTIQYYLNAIGQSKLIPLMNDDPRLPVLARMMGFLISEGPLRLHFSTNNDETMFSNDVSYIGLERLSLCTLLFALGSNQLKVPDWVIKGSEMVRREFISGYQGKHGGVILKERNTTYKFSWESTCQEVHLDQKESLTHFMSQCIKMLEGFGVQVGTIVEKQVDDDKIMLSFALSNEPDHMIHYYDTIGYRYDNLKIISSGQAVELLKIRRHTKEKNKIDPSVCYLYLDEHMSPQSTKNNVCSIYVYVESIEEVDNQLISDITVESENHSFVAGNGNFLSSNSAMGKQAMGIYATNFRYRMDTVAHILRYPQLPLVNSRVIKYLPSNDLPSGINAVVAIASFSGFNQEDSIIMNKSAVERGLFVSDHYHTYKDEEKKRQSSSVKMQEKFVRPNPKNTLGMRGNNYTKITETGLPLENTCVLENDVIIGKTHPIHSKKDDKELYRCCSTSIKAGEEGFVDKVIVSRNGDGYKFVKVRIRNSRYPTVGDKHACYTDKHQVLTQNRGWIGIKEVSVKDTIAVLKEGKLDWEQPTQVQCYAFYGTMFRIDQGPVQMEITHNHRMWIKIKGKDAYEIKYMKDLANEYFYIHDENNEEFLVEPCHIQAYDFGGCVECCCTGRSGSSVYCCTVPSGILLTRYFIDSVHRTYSHPVWCGNSRHGQKGTVGMVYNQEDMPFTKQGIKPDLIMNPHAVPSRMTIAQVIECLMGKTGVNLGMYGDGTAFTKVNEHKLGDLLEQLGFHRHCDEILYNGRTGEQLKVPIFIGPTYYQRLKHMTADKMHSRNQGPNVILTRQPVEGRSRDGGLRFGEMERDVILSHGAAQFLKETLQDRSDNYRMFICEHCGLVCAVNKEISIFHCKNCNNATQFAEIRLPYAMKLFIQELETMSIAPRLVTKTY